MAKVPAWGANTGRTIFLARQYDADGVVVKRRDNNNAGARRRKNSFETFRLRKSNHLSPVRKENETYFEHRAEVLLNEGEMRDNFVRNIHIVGGVYRNDSPLSYRANPRRARLRKMTSYTRFITEQQCKRTGTPVTGTVESHQRKNAPKPLLYTKPAQASKHKVASIFYTQKASREWRRKLLRNRLLEALNEDVHSNNTDVVEDSIDLLALPLESNKYDYSMTNNIELHDQSSHILFDYHRTKDNQPEYFLDSNGSKSPRITKHPLLTRLKLFFRRIFKTGRSVDGNDKCKQFTAEDCEQI